VPKFCTHFYPIPDKPYLALFLDTDKQSSQYDYWDVVLSIISPYLQNSGIDIVDVSAKNPTLPFAPSKQQEMHIIKHASLCLGPLDYHTYVANALGVRSVSILSHSYPENISPPFNKPISTVISPDFSNEKPSFSSRESKKRINEIHPEKIAEAVFFQLRGIIDTPSKASIKSLFVGESFQEELIEVVPDFSLVDDNLNSKRLGECAQAIHQRPINIRADLHYNERNIGFWGLNFPSHLIVDREVPFKILEAIKSNLACFTIILDKDSLSSQDKIKKWDNYFSSIRKLNTTVRIVTRDPDILNQLRVHFFDYLVLLDAPQENASEDFINKILKNGWSENNESLKFFTKKRFISMGINFQVEFLWESLKNDEVFCENALFSLDIPLIFELNKFSIKELDNIYVYEENS
jgi:hypothetical protein